MFNLIISIFCSVLVGVLFKKVKPNLFESFLMITINYLIAFGLSYFLFQIDLSNTNLDYSLVIPLVILMPSVFYILNKSINKSGIIKTDISQRISLIIPITASFLLFGESITLFKWFGIILGFIAVFLMLYKQNQIKSTNSIYLVLVFLGYGIIDVFFKQIAFQNQIPYITYLFLIFIGCFISSIIFLLIVKKKNKIKLQTVTFGLVLGILNFCNIYFYMKAHKVFSQQPSTVFAVMNFGVIALATVVGYCFFNEKLSRNNILGLLLAITAIFFILVSQFNYI